MQQFNWNQAMSNSAVPERIHGVRLVLRLITPEDADYVYSLRTDARYNTHLSPVTGSVADQRAWIEQYKWREAAGQEYYYIIERRDNGQACGTVRLYDIQDTSFTWGSWILDENKPAKAALESAVLVYQVGFNVFGTNKSIFDVRKDNQRTIEFHRRFDAVEISSDLSNIYFEYTREQFLADQPGHRIKIIGEI